jgi:hypothetical protein
MVHVIFICVAFTIVTLQSQEAGSQFLDMDQPDFEVILRAHAGQLASVTSDEEARNLFTTRLSSALDFDNTGSLLVDAPTASKGLGGMSVAHLSKIAIELTAAMAAWRLAASIKEVVDAGDNGAPIQAVQHEASRQQRWLFDKRENQALRRALTLCGVLTQFQTPYAAELRAPHGYDEYAGYLDHTYPQLIGSESSWLAIAEQNGLAAIHQRLMTFGGKALLSNVEKQKFASRYFQIRLRPALTAQVVALAIRAEADAQKRTREQWLRMRSWRDTLRETQGLERLCGTWQWTIHNHSNHQDHKTIVFFPPPDASVSPSPHPARIVVLGDTVYLRWEFQGGYQEESLLFARENQRLEGNFVNSAGAWGSITGKRTAPCNHEAIVSPPHMSQH